MSRLSRKKIIELVDIFNNLRVPLSSKERENLEKIFPYYGAQGIVDKVDNYLFDGEFILVAEDGENLRSNNQNICNLVNAKFWVNNHAHILKANNSNVTRYLFYNFNRIKFEPFVTGSAQPKLNKENLLSIETFVHSKEDQQKIAAVLFSLDSKIELNNSINTELEQMAKTLYDYWFVQFDFPDKNGKPYKSSGGKMVWNEVLKREIPEGWEDEQIDNLGTIIGGSTPSKSNDENFSSHGIPWITPKDLSLNRVNKFISKGELDVSETGFKSASLNLLPSYSVLMSSRAPVGYLAINRFDCTTNQGFKSIICNKEYNHEYIYYVLNQYMPVIDANATGSTFKEISATVFKSIKIIKPEKQIINYFIKKVQPIFEKQDNLEQQNQQLASLRDWLLPMLMNGQVTITDGKQ